MKKFLLYLILFTFPGCLNPDPNWSISEGTDKKEGHPANLIAFQKSLTSHKLFDNSDENITPDLRLIQEHLTEMESPFSESKIATDFLDKIAKKNEVLLIRNGNHTDAVLARKQYEALLGNFQNFCESMGISQNIKRNKLAEFKRDLSAPQKRKLWRSMIKYRSAIKKSFDMYKRHLKLMLSTELAIFRQEEHCQELAEHMNRLKNLDGSPLPVYIFSHYKITRSLYDRMGLSIISWHKGLFTTDSPATRHLFPDLPRQEKALTVHLRMNSRGRILSHEFGHLFYLLNHWEEYQQFIQAEGNAYQVGGHGPNDPSGLAAELAELGIVGDRRHLK